MSGKLASYISVKLGARKNGAVVIIVGNGIVLVIRGGLDRSPHHSFWFSVFPGKPDY